MIFEDCILEDCICEDCIFGISWGYLGDILGISWVYLGDILGISWGYFGDNLGISWGYFGDILRISLGYLVCNWGVFDGFCISSAIHTHSSNTYARPERRRREDGRKKKQQLDHPPHCNSLILSFGSFMFSLFKSFLCSNLSIWLDRPVVSNGSRCYISILDGLVSTRPWPVFGRQGLVGSSGG